jgi:hypothetical protein
MANRNFLMKPAFFFMVAARFAVDWLVLRGCDLAHSLRGNGGTPINYCFGGWPELSLCFLPRALVMPLLQWRRWLCGWWIPGRKIAETAVQFKKIFPWLL